MKTDKETRVQDLKDLVIKFRGERGWDKEFTPRNTAISIAIEAAELLEHFQWDGYKKTKNEKELAKELADVIIFCLHFSDITGIDISDAVRKKVAAAEKKYPLSIFNPNNAGTEDYFRIKQQYRKGKK